MLSNAEVPQGYCVVNLCVGGYSLDVYRMSNRMGEWHCITLSSHN